MNQLRDNTGVILWILVFAFGVIWVLQDSGGLDVVGLTGNNIGAVNGEAISFEEYSQSLDSQIQNYQQQTGESMPPQMLDQTRDRVFDQLVDTKLRNQETERLGLGVSDRELVEMIQGADPHPVIKRYLGDGTGGVDRSLLQNFIANPDARNDWLQIEDYLRGERLREKLDNLVAGSVRVSDADLQAEYDRRNRTVDVEFVALRFSDIPNDSIEVTDRDLRRFYDANREEFARKRSWTLRYATLAKTPTPEDTAAVLDDLEDLRQDFAESDDDSLFVTRNGSSRPYTDAYFRPDELEEAVSEAVFANAEAGMVVGPVLSGTEAHLIKIVDLREPEEPAVRARHILFRAAEDDDEARSEARTEARDILARLRAGEDFEALAREFSSDGSAQNGGDLGWFGPGRMVAPFEEAAFDAPVGRVVGPVETQFGYHLIEVTERATMEAKIVDYALPLRASIATLTRLQERLDDLQYFAEEGGDFAGEAERSEIPTTVVQIEDEQQFIPGIGNSSTLMNSLIDAEVGDVTPVIELNDQFMVGTIEAIQPEGYRDFDEVRGQIEPRARNEKKAEVLRDRLESALESNDFAALAGAVGSELRTANGLSYSNMVVPTLGRDPEFVGSALGLQNDEVSEVIEGRNAVYVIHATGSRDPGAISDAEKNTLRTQMLTQRQNQVRSQWLAALRDQAEVVDNRRRVLLQ